MKFVLKKLENNSFLWTNFVETLTFTKPQNLVKGYFSNLKVGNILPWIRMGKNRGSVSLATSVAAPKMRWYIITSTLFDRIQYMMSQL